jgi:molybdate/tungstate transport system substrate-binding protein
MTQRTRRGLTGRFGSIGVAMLAAVATAATACGGGGSSNASGGGGGGSAMTSGTTSPSAAAAGGGGGTVRVLHAGSLQDLMEKKLGPAFEKATGDGFQHYGTGSTKLAHAIEGGARSGDVYISANTKANKILMPKQESWYGVFARSPVVIAYSQKSKFAKALKTKPWYQVVTQEGFKLGTTNPASDPKGKKAQKAIQAVAKKTGKPALAKKIKSHTKQYAETALTTRVQSGQLDAGFFYSVEAKAVNLPTVSIKPADQAATYTVTVLRNAKHKKAGVDFVGFLLANQGTKILKSSGFKVVRPAKLTGQKQAVPTRLGSEVSTG